METSTMVVGRAVLCDDDALIRSVIRQVLSESPIEVVGEADSPEDAMEIVERADANIVVLDLALRGGNGEQLLKWAKAQHRPIHVVVYSSYAADPGQLLAAGADAVIEKPDFGRLHTAIDSIASSIGVPVDRRRRSEARGVSELPPPTAVSLSGFEPWNSFLAAAGAAGPGETILCGDIVPGPRREVDWDVVFATDHRIALGRAMATGRRAFDRISMSPTGRPVLLLIGGHPEAANAVYQRMCDRWGREVDVGSPVGAFGLIHRSDDPLERLVLVEAAVPADRTASLRMV